VAFGQDAIIYAYVVISPIKIEAKMQSDGALPESRAVTIGATVHKFAVKIAIGVSAIDHNNDVVPPAIQNARQGNRTLVIRGRSIDAQACRTCRVFPL